MSTATATSAGLRALCNRDGLLAAFQAIAAVAPAKSPKPILSNLLLTTDETGSILSATDLEVGVRYRVLGVKSERLGRVILPTAKMAAILRTSSDGDLFIEVDDDQLHVRGSYSQFKLPSEDPDLFPEVPRFEGVGHTVAAAELKRMIRRTIFATDTESTRYALGGVLFEFGECLTLVATDGRRLAQARAPMESADGSAFPKGQVVVPLKALKLLDRLLDDGDPAVEIAITGSSTIAFRTDQAEVWTRLVEGRFPRYQDVFPTGECVRVPLEVGSLKLAVEQATIVTSEESRGVDFTFKPGRLVLDSRAPDVGTSEIELPIDYEGAPVEITFDPRYLADALKTLDDGAALKAELIDHKNAAVFKTEDDYTYVVMPLTRDR